VSEPEPVASPCIEVCRLDERQVCLGCGRTIGEIAEWSAAGRERRLAIRAAAAARRAHPTSRTPDDPS
jgi:predicted Fe-S protein YdhL (DUF1289 family)